MRAMELFLLINNSYVNIYYDVFEEDFTYNVYNEKHLKEMMEKYDENNSELNHLKINIKLPTYEEIDHEGIMRFYVKKFVEEKDIRKTLFSILSRNDYVVPFIEKLKELDLYEDYYDACGEIYTQLLIDWSIKHNIKL